MKYKLAVLVVIISILVIIMIRIRSDVTSGETNGKNVIQIEIYYNNPCESCNEEEKALGILSEHMKDLKKLGEVKYKIYNVFNEQGRNHLIGSLETLDKNLDDLVLPALIINQQLVSGSYENISEYLSNYNSIYESDVLINHTVQTETSSDLVTENQQVRFTQEENQLVLFTTSDCSKCKEAEAYLEKIKAQYVGSGTDSKLLLQEYNITQENYSLLIYQYFERYNVPDRQQQVPILFYADGFLSGKNEISAQLENKIKAGKVDGFSLDMNAKVSNETKDFEKDIWKLIVTGFINGLNPCSLSMLFMILSVLFFLKYDVWKGGLAYLSGKAVAYILIGLTVYSFSSFIEKGLLVYMSKVLTYVIAIIAIGLGILNLIDFINARKQAYGKILVQLPKGLRNWNHKIIKKIERVQPKYMMVALFVLGFIISFGEFFCTGQIYMAMILYLMRTDMSHSTHLIPVFMIYVVAMCAPQVLLLILINKRGNTNRTSQKVLENLPLIKLIYALFFLIMGISFLFFI